MFKAMILLTRREDMTPDDFRRWWLEEHRPLALQLPGLRRMVVNIVAADPGETGIDGISELWFDTQADFEADYATEIGKRVVDRLAAACRARGARLHVVMLGEGPRPDGLEVLRHAAAADVGALDLTTRYQELLAKDPTLRRRWFRGHMTREGNGWVAEQVAAALAAPK